MLICRGILQRTWLPYHCKMMYLNGLHLHSVKIRCHIQLKSYYRVGSADNPTELHPSNNLASQSVFPGGLSCISHSPAHMTDFPNICQCVRNQRKMQQIQLELDSRAKMRYQRGQAYLYQKLVVVQDSGFLVFSLLYLCETTCTMQSGL